MERNGRKLWIDSLRILMAFLVVMLHVASAGVVRRGVWMLGSGWMWSNIWDSIARCSVPVFVMISGSLLLSSDADVSESRLRQRFLRLLGAYFFWSALYSIWFMAVKFKGNALSLEGMMKFLEKLLLGGYGHLWFLPMMMGLYLILPFMRRIAEDCSLCVRFLVIWFVFWVVSPCLGCIPLIGDALERFLSSFQVLMPLGYVGYFLLGHVLTEADISGKKVKAIYFLGIIGVCITAIGTSLLSAGKEKAVLSLYDYWMPNNLIAAVAVFKFFRNSLESKVLSDRIAHSVQSLSSLTFGIYLSHIFMIKLLDAFGINIYMMHTSISIPIISILVFVLSALLTALLKKAKLHIV